MDTSVLLPTLANPKLCAPQSGYNGYPAPFHGLSWAFLPIAGRHRHGLVAAPLGTPLTVGVGLGGLRVLGALRLRHRESEATTPFAAERLTGFIVGPGTVGLLLTSWLVISEILREPTCPDLLGVPACCLVRAGYAAATVEAWLGAGGAGDTM